MLDILESGITIPYYAQRRMDDMIHKCYNVIPGIKKERDSVILDLTEATVEHRFKEFINDVQMKKHLLSPPGIDLPRHTYPMFKIFHKYAKERGIAIKAIKGEVGGPLTEAYSVKVHPSGMKILDVEYFFNILVDFAAELCYTLAAKLGRFAYKVTGSSENAIFFIDEPLFPLVFDQIGPKTTFDVLNKVLDKIPVKSGIHICSDPISSLDFLLKLPVTYINYDCRKFKETLRLADNALLQQYLDRGSGFALGITPNTPEELLGPENEHRLGEKNLDFTKFLPNVSDIVADIEFVLDQVREKEIDVVQFLRQSLLTPQCGFMSFTLPTPEEGERIVKELLTIQEKSATFIRKKYRIEI